MFKFLVLSAFLAAAVAEPSVGLVAPLLPATYASTIAAPVAAPVATTYVQGASSYFGAPAVYSDIAYSHFIKKRSAPFYNTYVAPSTYIAGAPVTAPYASTYVASAPISYTSSVLSAPVAHFIKKRSAPLLAAPASYIAPAPLASSYIAATSPLATTYSSAILPGASYYSPYYSSSYLPTLPLIKK